MSTEEIAPVLAGKPWLKARRVNKDTEPDRWAVDGCDDMIVDSAVPEEIPPKIPSRRESSLAAR